MRGAVNIILLAAVVLLGGGGYVATKKGFFSGETKRAKESTKTTEDLIAAKDKQAAVAAASVVKIGEANAQAPDSPEKTFIAREVPVALSSLPPPNADALIAAERRKVAVLEGRLEEADKLYGTALQMAKEYQAEAKRAIAAKRASDLALEEAAAEARGAAADRLLYAIIAVSAIILYIWVKISHVSPLTLSAAIHDIRNGTGETNPAIAALDSALTPFQQANTRLMVWGRSKLAKLNS